MVSHKISNCIVLHFHFDILSAVQNILNYNRLEKVETTRRIKELGDILIEDDKITVTKKRKDVLVKIPYKQILNNINLKVS